MTRDVLRRVLPALATSLPAPSARRRIQETKQAPIPCVGPSIAAPSGRREGSRRNCAARFVLPRASHAARRYTGHTSFLPFPRRPAFVVVNPRSSPATHSDPTYSFAPSLTGLL